MAIIFFQLEAINCASGHVFKETFNSEYNANRAAEDYEIKGYDCRVMKQQYDIWGNNAFTQEG